jgi:uncharacterized LabA/DUF88 family protein
VKQSHGCHFDYKAFWDQVTAGREVVRAFAYAIDRGDPQQVRFQRTLESIGFEVKLKPFIQRSDGSAKGDWDVGITLRSCNVFSVETRFGRVAVSNYAVERTEK